MSKEKNRPRLGRGLSSLLSIPDPDHDSEAATADKTSSLGFESNKAKSSEGVDEIPIDSVRPNPHQPRRSFNEASLNELAASLRFTGLVQPIVVKRIGEGTYELIAGERRLRAAKLAGLTALPAIIRNIDGPTQAQMALVENIQREDLNPIDRAHAYRKLMDSLGLTQAELATRLGEDRSSIGHYLRLLDLVEPVQEWIRDGKLTLGHAKLIAGISDMSKQEGAARRALDDGLSVRGLEELLQTSPATTTAEPPASPRTNAHIRDLEQTFTRHLGMKVQIRASAANRNKGKLIIQYTTLDQFDSLKNKLGIETD